MEHGGLRKCRHLKPIQSSYLVVRYTLVCMLPVPFVFVFNWFLFFSLSNTIVPSVETICLLMLQPRKKCVETISLLMLQPRKFTQIAEKNYNWNSCFYETLGSEICLCARPVTIYHVCSRTDDWIQTPHLLLNMSFRHR